MGLDIALCPSNFMFIILKDMKWHHIAQAGPKRLHATTLLSQLQKCLGLQAWCTIPRYSHVIGKAKQAQKGYLNGSGSHSR